MNEVIRMSSTIVNARARMMPDAEGNQVLKVILGVDNAREVIMPLTAISNILDHNIKSVHLEHLDNAKIYYTALTVKEGDMFSFVEGGDINEATRDLYVTNVTGIQLEKEAKAVIRELPVYTQIDNDIPKSPAIDIEAIAAQIKGATNINACRALAQEHAIFDDNADAFEEFTTAAQYQAAFTDILTNMDV